MRRRDEIAGIAGGDKLPSSEMARPTSKNIVGVRVVRARKRLKMTQLDLSRRLTKAGTTLDRAAIAKIETGIRRVTDYELLAIARKLDVDVQWLLTGRSRNRTCKPAA